MKVDLNKYPKQSSFKDNNTIVLLQGQTERCSSSESMCFGNKPRDFLAFKAPSLQIKHATMVVTQTNRIKMCFRENNLKTGFLFKCYRDNAAWDTRSMHG